MKKRFITDTKSSSTDIALLVARVAIAALMLTHGLPKLQMLFSGDAIQFPAVLGMSAGLLLALAVFAEVFCSILILIGFATRLAVIPLIVTMLVAVFRVHAADAFAIKELALLYLAGYIVLFIAGSGIYSIGHLLQNRKVPVNHTGRKVQYPAFFIHQ